MSGKAIVFLDTPLGQLLHDAYEGAYPLTFTYGDGRHRPVHTFVTNCQIVGPVISVDIEEKDSG